MVRLSHHQQYPMEKLGFWFSTIVTQLNQILFVYPQITIYILPNINKTLNGKKERSGILLPRTDRRVIGFTCSASGLLDEVVAQLSGIQRECKVYFVIKKIFLRKYIVCHNSLQQ